MVRAAADTAEAFSAGRNTFGLPKMKEVFGEPITKKCVEWLGAAVERLARTDPLLAETAEGLGLPASPERASVKKAPPIKSRGAR